MEAEVKDNSGKEKHTEETDESSEAEDDSDIVCPVLVACVCLHSIDRLVHD